MSDILKKDIALIRITIMKEKKDYYIGKDFIGNKYKLLKNEDSKHLIVGDDRYHYVEVLKGTLLFSNVLRLLSKKEEYELSNANASKFSSLADLGMSISNL
jgi:hypothetical protein